jgi:hypothetical protein
MGIDHDLSITALRLLADFKLFIKINARIQRLNSL